ncbi:bifunctional diguanylate cyclase/phosphodiesterase [Klenkia taihuensis]|uniref:bifunctional diguanylate cyclase/phosphodiesterase n=1 Tax=Klenkia taihuensis TaxID=1225127 RepID=UPI000B804B0C|nr:bifunctional diguanylate cyclase/phosphodiesterase [Klenkia taihuensis]GHE10956.1 bifunctional diguanylate cyclase/phosphodiesterase [Klenkia taihuensis]
MVVDAPSTAGAPRRALHRSPWAPTLLAVVLAVAFGVPVLHPAIGPVSWWVVGLVFVGGVVAESVPLHVEFGRETYAFSLMDLVLVIGLLEVGPFWTFVARTLALLVTLVHQRYQLPKLVFNIANGALEVALAGLVLGAFGSLDIAEPLTWLALLTALIASTLGGTLLVSTAITLTAGPPGWEFWRGMLATGIVMPVLGVGIAIVVLILVGSSAWTLVVVLPLVIAVLLLFRTTARVGRERRTVQQVYDFARRVEEVSPDEAGVRQIASAVRELLNAERVALWLPPFLEDGPRLVVVGNAEVPDWYAGPSDPEDPIRRRAVDPVGGGPVLVASATATDEESAALARRGADEVLGAPVVTAAGEHGYLEVCDRRSDLVSFEAGDRAALDAMLTHVNAAIRQQQLLTRIRYDADHDALTGLPNRQRLAVEIDTLLSAEPGDVRAGLVFASLDNYTEVTDTLGHAASDELLLVTAGLLREHAPPRALVARMEGGQFAVLLPGLSLPATERAARRLRDAAATRARVAGLDLDVLLTFGVAAAPVHGDTSGTLMQRADVALLAGHSSGGVASYHPVLDQQSLRRLQLGTELESAMAEKQITVVFQPIVDTRTSDIVSVETLVRWAHPRYGNVPPDDFIGLAEQIGRIGAVTDYVLDLALERCRKWLDQDIALSVAVNLSAKCLAEPDLVDRVRAALRRHGVPGSLLTLELTEGIVVDDSVRNSTVLADLHALGLRLSMDDFGTGYSSLSQLRQLPIDELKIDKSFVLGMSTSQSESFIARSIVELAHNLGLRVVAEGVEDEVTRDLLAEMGCDKLQGFLVSRPLPDDRLENWLLARTGVRSAAPGAPHRRLFVRS